MQVIEKPIEELKEYEGNPRSIPDAAIDAVATSIRQFGFRTPIIVDGDCVIIAGHTRLRAAQKLGLKAVPVHVADLPPEKVKALRTADNQTGTLVHHASRTGRGAKAKERKRNGDQEGNGQDGGASL